MSKIYYNKYLAMMCLVNSVLNINLPLEEGTDSKLDL